MFHASVDGCREFDDAIFLAALAVSTFAYARCILVPTTPGSMDIQLPCRKNERPASSTLLATYVSPDRPAGASHSKSTSLPDLL